MAITITRIEKSLNSGVPAGTTLANHTFSVDIGDIVINDTEDKTLNNYVTTPTSGTIKYDNSSGGRGLISDTFELRFYIEGNYIRRARYQTEANTDRGYTLSANVLGTMVRKSYWWDTDHTVSDYFNSSNKTSPTVEVDYRLHYCFLQTKPAAVQSYGDVGYATYNDTTTDIGSIKLRLNVPPTFDNTALSIDTATAYTNITTASVTVSNATAYYGGDISSATLTIGNQTASISGNGTISILLNAGGTFTPTITVTDSRGQTATRTLDPITVNVYTAPSVSFTVERTTATGAPEDEGAYATVDATFTFADVIADVVAPTVAVTDEDGVQTTPTVTWYSSRATDGTLSGSVTWANLSSGDTVYGLIPNLNTEFSWQIAITPRDTEGTGTPITQTLAGAFYTIDFLAGGHGIAFGQPASDVGFFCNMDAHFVDANSVMRALFDFVYPVGSYYETSDTAFDPNTTWGGTWVLENEGQVHVSAGSNYKIGDTGGKEKVTLSAAIGACNNNISSLGYITDGPSAYQNAHSATFVVSGSSIGFNKWNHSTPVTDRGVNERDTSIMQPYIVVNRWHRTA